MLSPGHSTTSISSPSVSSTHVPSKRQRILACVLCQQRKVKCDRNFPCSNCTKSAVQCVPASPTQRQRRRRFPERELLGRLRHYENLLRQNNVWFDPLHHDNSSQPSISHEVGKSVLSPASSANPNAANSELRPYSGSARPHANNSRTSYDPRNLWQVMGSKAQDDQETDESEDERDTSPSIVKEKTVRQVWDQLYEGNDNLLFALPSIDIDLRNLHPEQVQIFRLWQIYLDNVSPLLRVTHTPSIQARIIDAVGNITEIEQNLEALMFSIYSVAIVSLTEAECRSSFGEPKKELLATYHRGLQQALRISGFLQSDNRDCLTAILLYLISIRSYAHPKSVSSMLGIAIRMAQRMGIHNEAQNMKCSALEAEMRRRIWWALVIFDARISDLADGKCSMLVPTWDCKIPLNANDFDLHSEMKSSPAAHMVPTEALYVVVRCKIADYIRHSPDHLDFVNPALKNLVESTGSVSLRAHSDFDSLERDIEDRYLRFCNPENPLHFMTIWMSRCFLAKCRLLEIHVSRDRTERSHEKVNSAHDAILTQALRMLECDTNIAASPLTKGYTWLLNLHFQGPGYIITMQDLARRPVGEHADQAWKTMSGNYAARFNNADSDEGLFIKIFAPYVLHAWRSRTAKLPASSVPETPPFIVTDLMKRTSQGRQAESDHRLSTTDQIELSDGAAHMAESSSWKVGAGDIPNFDFGMFDSLQSGLPMGMGLDQLDWMSMDWNVMQQGSGW